jgi:hypothetical protein
MTGSEALYADAMESWSGQLISADILFAFNVRVIPVVEVIVGVLCSGLIFSCWGLIVINMMLVATYSIWWLITQPCFPCNRRNRSYL